MARAEPPEDLERNLGYQFKDQALLKRALTHASMRSSKRRAGGGLREQRSDNERLEFLGDRVLGLAVSELLWQDDADATEGDLARRFNHLVRKESCAVVARSLELGRFLIMSTSEAGSGGRDKEAILGDACEGLLGALFVEAGFEVARDIIRRHWAPLVDKLPQAEPDAKSQLQEWAQGQGLDLPRYEDVARSGPDHAPLFKTRVHIDGRKPASGKGPSKRAAEQAAAIALLKREGVREGGAND